MRPETLRKRVEALRQRREDAEPLGKVPVLLVRLGEDVDEVKARAGVAPGQFCVCLMERDFSIPRAD